MRAWLADADGRLHEVTGFTSIGRAVDRFVVWDAGRQVLTAPRLLRAVAFDGCTVGVRFREHRLADAREAYGDRSGITFEGPRMTARDVRAVEVVHESYPASFERLFRDTDHDLCLRVRGGADVFLDAELVDVAP
ncbi:hypothetical protein [Halorarius halobius]|uniref:hypothetical protein n=1 Tax=Halorarius halobius TaxID=2962671 RepID=UPI0020CBE089|nr:hypothetical protein [Halorarius halobius]